MSSLAFAKHSVIITLSRSFDCLTNGLPLMDRLKRFAADYADGLVFVGALAAVATGAGFVYWPLALIVPGAIVLSLMVYRQVRDVDPPNDPPSASEGQDA